MGQAKNRGTFEERQKAAIERDKPELFKRRTIKKKPVIGHIGGGHVAGIATALLSMLGNSIINNRR